MATAGTGAEQGDAVIVSTPSAPTPAAPAKPPTINDVARLAGVSRQTVTRALNDMPDVSAETRQRVVDAAATLRYRPNRAAQRLVHGGDVTIGFIVGDLRNPYYPELASEITRRAAEHDWSVIVTDLSGPDGEERVNALTRRVDVVIGHLGRAGRMRLGQQVPTVSLDDDESTSDARVRFDYRGGIAEVVAYLVAKGRTRVAMIDAAHGPTMRSRLFHEALDAHGLSPVAEVSAPDTHSGGIAAAESLVERRFDGDAVLCFNDVLAVGALKGFARAGILVPQEVAVIGIDGLDIGTLVTPELTTLAVDMSAVAQHAVDLVGALLRGETGTALQRTITHSLVLRESA